MPRYAKSNEERWLHPNYRKAYCFRYRNGMVYTSVNSVRQATGFEWHPRNKKVCMDILNQRLRETIIPTKKNDVKMLSELIMQFHRDKVIKLNKATQSHYKTLYKQYLNFDLPLTDIQEIRNRIIDKKNFSTQSNNTIWKKIQRLKKLFEYAVELEWMEKNPIPKALIPEYKHKEVVTCTKEHIEILLQHFNNTGLLSMAYMLEFAFITALRIQEILNIEWEDIEENILIIKGKGGRKRILPLRSFPRAKEILLTLKEEGLPKPFNWKNQQTPAKNLRNALEKCKVKYPEMTWEISFHVIRKTTINIWRNAGISGEVRNLIAGHSKDVEKGFYLSTPEIQYLEKELELLSKM
ncbi:MAG: tyrosine-type recombinase/integrase [Candidatus Kapabacteria bacterium]|nr:tyrosine-type recombinase/integrase [Candidatus Kapabacteria bacterium]